MTRADRKRARQCSGKQRSVADRKLVAAAIKAGICPCKSVAENPGEHLPACPWSDPDFGGLPW